MAEDKSQKKQKTGRSKLKLALGAAGLFLFIVGVKKTFQLERSTDPEATEGDTTVAGTQAPADTGASGAQISADT